MADLRNELAKLHDERLCGSRLGPLLVCALVLLFCSILLFSLWAERDGDDVVAEILIEELTSSAPKLIPPVDGGLTAIEDDRQRLSGEVVSNSDVDDEPFD